MLTPEQVELVEYAFNSLDRNGSGIVPLEYICCVFDASMHPRVKEGRMAPSAAREMLIHQFGESASHNNNNNNNNNSGGGVTLDVFLGFHERMAREAEVERVRDPSEFLTKLIKGIWRLGELLMPTYIRPAINIHGLPTGIYATQAMSLIWPANNKDKDNNNNNKEKEMNYELYVIRDVVQPIFARGDLPAELQGFFAYPSELAGMQLKEISPQIAMQRWLDFVWEYDNNKFAGVEGIISARVDLEILPNYLRNLIREHREVKSLQSIRFIPTCKALNPMYKRSSDEYGYGVPEEIKRIHQWKEKTYEGKAYGLIYHGRVGKFTKNHYGHAQSTAASGINL